jgi:hypothetical protein
VKQKDISLIIIVSFVSAMMSFFLSNALISTPENRQQQVSVVEPITAEFPEPDKKYFNEKSVNPTQLIRIGDTDNPNPLR